MIELKVIDEDFPLKQAVFDISEENMLKILS